MSNALLARKYGREIIGKRVNFAMDRKTTDWVKDALTNFDNTSDEELRAYFIDHGLSEKQSDHWLTKRSFYSLNVVMQDDEGNDVGIFDPHTTTIKPRNSGCGNERDDNEPLEE